MLGALPDSPTIATYVALLISILALWISRPAWVVALGAAIALGYASGVLNTFAALFIGLLATLCILYRRMPALVGVGVVTLATLLALHVLPGFNNFRVVHNVVLTPGAEPYSLYLNFDKTVAGVLILGLLCQPLLRTWNKWRVALKRALPILLINILVVMAIALSMGYLRFDPKWSQLFWIWAAANLFFACMTEEAFFRGFIQRELAKRVKAAWVPVAISAVLFGLAHFAGGWSYVLLATIAGAGYALVFQRTQSVEMAMLAHFALNATHFLLLTYPRSV